MRKNQSLFTLFLMVVMLVMTGMQSYGATLRGQVADSEGNFLPAALVEAINEQTGSTRATTTSLDGAFEMQLDPGTYTVKVTYLGYIDKSVSVEVRQDTNMGTIVMESSTIGLQEVRVVSAYARDRQTPVAISTISGEIITEKLGTQEFPEILKLTPSVYATKDGGGYGDSRINLRGFDSNNIGVLVNGVPVNDMENGQVYWSNWAGLSDVTSSMQVQRGLGASRLAISSVGGTINILTRSSDAQKRGSVSTEIGSDGYRKNMLTLSTGLLDNGWAATFSGSHNIGTRFVRGLDYEGWSYFANVSKQINKSHTLSFTAFGAPQTHNQRYPRQLIQVFREHRDGIRYNPSLGYMNGEQYSASYNFYHKPQISLNHFWSINPETTLSTAVYGSFSQGGGRRIYGANANWLRYDSNTGLPREETKLTPDGFLDFDAVIQENGQAVNGSRAIVSNAINAHDWYGMLSNLSAEMDNIMLTGGLDLRYYKGYHYQQIDNLLGGEYYLDVTSANQSLNINRDPNTHLREGDYINYYNLGEVRWAGLFGQAEYVQDQYSAFLSANVSNTGYRRTDYFKYLDDSPEQQSDWVNFNAWSLKGGANYNIDESHNVFFNTGYFTRAPFFRWAFIGFSNDVNEGVKHEKVFSAEAGYGYRSRYFSANATVYRTNWIDRALVRRIGPVTANLTGLSALHQGIELDFIANPIEKVQIRGMFSIGDWEWTDDVIADLYDEQQQFISTQTVYAGDLMVGNSAQTTGGFSVDYDVLPQVKLGVDFTHFDRLFADFDVQNRTVLEEKGIQAWQMPSYQVVDLSARYNFRIADLNASLFAKVDNVLDTEYIADATDGSSFDFDTATVFYGF
ncbi:MAG: TonB-dependent receptor, partial [Bacteroidales bacterium]